MIECVNTFKQGNEEVLHIVAENQTWDIVVVKTAFCRSKFYTERQGIFAYC